MVENDTLADMQLAMKGLRSRVIDEHLAEEESTNFILGVVLKMLKGDSYNGIMCV